MNTPFTGQIIMPELKHNKEFNACYKTELDRIMESKEVLKPWICSRTNKGYEAYCRRMAHVAALKKLYWEKKTA